LRWRGRQWLISTAEQMDAPSAQPARGRCPAIPEVNTIEPPGRMPGLPYFAARNAPQTCRRGVGARQAAELQRLTGGEDQVIERADPLEQRRHRGGIGKVARMALGARG
jgi:hypothetical protein